MNYSLYSDILEFEPNEILDLKKLESYEIFNHFHNFLINNRINNVLISLSGGVDSMVILTFCKYIKSINSKFNFISAHLNYNNRTETTKEEEFLKDWCKYNEIIIEVLNINHIHRGEGNRNEYEEETRNIRYKFYSDIIKKYNCFGVILAHHKDDYSENVFNNIMRGQNNITNLGVFKEEKVINNVRVLRPLLKFKKEKIYEISNDFQVPYFLDTTPSWSCRGQMRNEIFPKCDKCYGSNFMNNLHQIGKQSEDINFILNKFIIDPILKDVSIGKYGFIIPKREELKQQIVFENVIDNITFNLEIKTTKRKLIVNLISKMKENYIGEIHFVSGLKCFILEKYIICLKMQDIKNVLSNLDINNENYLCNYIFVTNLEKDLINGILYYKIKKNKLKNLINEPISKYIPNINNFIIDKTQVLKLNICDK